jgi:hypothetical protein
MKYEVRVKYAHINPTSGKEVITTENYIIADAETWADAEQQLYEQMAKITNQSITKIIKLSDIIDIVKSEGDYWYKTKLEMKSIDEVSGKEKSIKEMILIQADGFKDAHEKAQEYCLEILVPVEIVSISKSNIVDIFDADFIPKVKVVTYSDEDTEDEEQNLPWSIPTAILPNPKITNWEDVRQIDNDMDNRISKSNLQCEDEND